MTDIGGAYTVVYYMYTIIITSDNNLPHINWDLWTTKSENQKPNVFWRYCKSKTIIKQGIGGLSTDYTDIKLQTTTKCEEKAHSFADYFSCVFITEQPGFIPTLPTVNNKTEINKLNITEYTILSILQ